MNTFLGVGRITRDLELKQTQSGVSVVAFTIAINRNYADSDGNYQTDFINCVAFRNQAENLVKFMKKGSQIGVEGRLQTRTYQRDDGSNVYVVEVIANQITFLEPKSDSKMPFPEVEKEETPQQDFLKALNPYGDGNPF